MIGLPVRVLPAGLLALQTRYVADAMPVLMVCLGFVFLPLVIPRTRRTESRHADDGDGAGARAAGVFTTRRAASPGPQLQ